MRTVIPALAVLSCWIVPAVTGGLGRERSVRAAGARTVRAIEEHLADTVSVLDFIPVELHARIREGSNTEDLSPYIQSAIDSYASGSAPFGRVHVPRGRYRIERTITLKGHQILVGDLGSANVAGVPGTDFAWHGPDGGTAFVTAASDTEDWSRSGIENIAITNATATTSGWGLKIRNPQNGSFLRHVLVRGFPTSQVVAYEPVGRKVGAGTAPGYWFVEDVFAIGGEIPVDLEVGVEQTEIRQLKVDTDARSTVGVRLKRAPKGHAQGAPVVVTSSFVEIAAGSRDVNGWEWTGDLAITFIGCGVQRNDAAASRKAAFLYAGNTRSIPSADLINCTSWRMGKLYEFEQAALSVPAANVDVPESFSWSRSHTDAAFPFGRNHVAARLSGPLFASGTPGAEHGIVMHRPGTIVGLSARYAARPEAGAITITIVKNATTPVRSITLDPAHQQRFEDFTSGKIIDRADFHFAAGDRIGASIATGPTLDPSGGLVWAEVFVRFR